MISVPQAMLEEDQTEQHPHPRDDSTMSMFGDETPNNSSKSYRVLARKYRPKLFSDLIGQEAMVHTLENAFRTGRIAHAFMLTGVRGVGKTTTARLLARGLNYVTDTVNKPSTVLDPNGKHCQAIMESSHPDVLELDAASRTGVADMRDLLDGVRYSAVSARYKVYIIDEVHMLSIAAFNALLKTLEEPPEHVKFIFATTEIRKVPVTVLSRCQRFDLKRLDIEVLKNHLSKIASKEGTSVEEEGLTLIARAAEGSVRDALSILDQAIVQAKDGQLVSSESIRDMIGLGDRNRILDVFENMIQGEGGAAINNIAEQIISGADPLVLIKDLLDICADIATAQAIGATNLVGSENWINRLNLMATKLTASQTALIWQMLLNGYQSAQLAPSTDTALKMVILRIAASSKLPSPEQAAKMLTSGEKQNPAESSAVSIPSQKSSDMRGKPTQLAQSESGGKIAQTRSASITELKDDKSFQKESSATNKSITKAGDKSDKPEQLIQPDSKIDIAPSIKPTGEFGRPVQKSAVEKNNQKPLGQLKSIDDVVSLMQNAKELRLAADFKEFIQIQEFEPGKISCSLKKDAPDALISKVTEKLNEMTGINWSIQTVDNPDNNGETVKERETRKKKEAIEMAKKDPNVRNLLDLVPGLEVTDVKASS